MKITLNSPLDMHLHLRDKDMLSLVAPLSAKYFSGAVIMPNLVPPITSKKQVAKYNQFILKITKKYNFKPYMTLFFQNYSKSFLNTIKDNIKAIKLYPAGITTNSDDGVGDFNIKKLSPTLQAMSDLGIILCIHGESDGFVMDREKEFLKVYKKLAKNFPKLKIIMEHITTKKATKLLKKYNNLFATITLHHLYITLDDVAGGLLKPHLFCKPIVKKPKDLKALQKLAFSGDKKVMFGSDSAPHPKHIKESCGCGAGVFTAPIALQSLVELFEKNNALPNLQAFVSDNARKIYNIKPIKKKITLIKKDFQVPMIYKSKKVNVVPMFYGNILKWSIV